MINQQVREDISKKLDEIMDLLPDTVGLFTLFVSDTDKPMSVISGDIQKVLQTLTLLAANLEEMKEFAALRADLTKH